MIGKYLTKGMLAPFEILVCEQKKLIYVLFL